MAGLKADLLSHILVWRERARQPFLKDTQNFAIRMELLFFHAIGFRYLLNTPSPSTRRTFAPSCCSAADPSMFYYIS